MKHILKIKGGEYEAEFVRERGKDPRHGRRSTVTIVIDMSCDYAVGLFYNPGEWTHTRQYEDGSEVVTDFTDYDKLLYVKDNVDEDSTEIVLSKMTAEEALAELKEVLEG